jgi:2-oxoglutarate dehydrogenase E2 component (dihydrolipoamide succinyltransferase)
MSESIIVPTLGESVTEATVAKWLKNEGDTVSADEAIVELETDKVNVEVPAPVNGKIEKISVKEGQTVNVGALLGTITQLESSEIKIKTKEKKYLTPQKKIELVQ